MSWADTLTIVSRSIRRRAARSLLTALGVAGSAGYALGRGAGSLP